MDDELLSALIENDELIIRKIDTARLLSLKLKNMKNGVDSLGDKIPRYAGSELVRQIKEKKEQDDKKKDGDGDGGGGGMYL